jgi:protochlorophyllide reductase
VKRMAERGHTVVMACRTLDKAKDAANRIQNELSTQKVNLIPTECNLADLNSVKNFAKGISDSGMDIDVLCLNAGIARNTSAKDVLRTKEGFELTIGTNHLGHFYLTQSILPLLEKGEGKGKRIVVTASGGK